MNFSFFQAAGTFLLPHGVSLLAHGQAGAEQQDGQRAGYWEETVAEQGVSFCEVFLLGIKNVFAKFDNRLG